MNELYLGQKDITDLQIFKLYEFTATVKHKAIKNYLKALSVELPEDVEVILRGNFTVSFDDKCPIVDFDCLYLDIGSLSLEVDVNNADLLQIADAIADAGPYMDWYEDYQASYVDYCYENYRDRVLEERD